MKLGDWKPVFVPNWNLKQAAVICEHLGCGSAVSLRIITKSLARLPTRIKPECVQSFSAVRECVTSVYSLNILDFTCSGRSSITSSVPSVTLTVSGYFGKTLDRLYLAGHTWESCVLTVFNPLFEYRMDVTSPQSRHSTKVKDEFIASKRLRMLHGKLE